MTIFVVVVLVKIFVLSTFSIPSQSMSPALVGGDYIVVNKLIPGTRYVKNDSILRLLKYRDIKRNDIIAFNFPYSGKWNKIKMDDHKYYVKRCIAIPGDTFYIENGINKVNGVNIALLYNDHQFHLSLIDDKILKKKKEIYNTFPFDTVNYKWSIKNFGPLYIPGKGDCILINSINIKLYRNLLEYESNKKISKSNDSIFLGNKYITEYTYKHNYYFVTGEQPLDSKDSRYWGLLPEDHIVGKAIFILTSKDPISGKYNLGRFFKSVK